mmetsp:Transcript_30195/g.38960  ORF Transcript_30195/g.38960 Transcript_30195/m.38960 type:complete len:253 (-) Transcript_30195:310-1068(-)
MTSPSIISLVTSLLLGILLFQHSLTKTTRDYLEPDCVTYSLEWKNILRRGGLKVSERKDIIIATGGYGAHIQSLCEYMKLQGFYCSDYRDKYSQHLSTLKPSERVTFDYPSFFQEKNLFLAGIAYDHLFPYLITAFPEATVIISKQEAIEWVETMRLSSAMAPWLGIYHYHNETNHSEYSLGKGLMSQMDPTSLLIGYITYTQFIKCSVQESKLIVVDVSSGDECKEQFLKELNVMVDWKSMNSDIRFPGCS